MAIISVPSHAQEIALPKGTNVIDATVGFWADYLPISAHYEHIVTDFGNYFSVGVGAAAAFGPYLGTEETFKNDNYSICDVIGSFHYSPIKALDLNVGLGLGYCHYLLSGHLHYTGHIGARYFFSNTFGATVQIGGSGVINFGASFKF